MSMTLFSGVSPLLLFIAKATLVLLAALVGAAFLRRGTAGARHLVWLAALVGVLALPLLSRIPALHLDVLPAKIALPQGLAPTGLPGDAAPALSRPARVVTYDADNGRILSVERSGGTPAARGPGKQSAPPSLLTTLLIAWAGVALSLTAWLIAGAVQVRRIVMKGRELASSDWTTPLCEVADRLDLEEAPRLVISDDIEMAFACRATEPTIVLPAIAESWTDDRRRAVLFHELAHVKRHDLLGHTLGRVACALYWFHPLVWTAARKLRAESERACDDLVLDCGARPSEYAQHLLDMVTSVRRAGAPVMAMPMARKKEFEGRMLAILDPAVRRASPGRVQSAVVVATIGALSLTIAAVAPARAARVPQIPTVQTSADSPATTRAEPDTRPDTPAPTKAAPKPSESVAVSDAPAAKVLVADTVERTERVNRVSLGDMIDKFGSNVAAAALNALQGVGTVRGQTADTARVGLLVKVLQTDSDASVRRSAAWALHDLPTTGARAALVQALGHDQDSQVREMAAWGLADFESDAAANALTDALLKDRDTHVRMTSAWALGQFDRSNGDDALISAVVDADASVRQAAIWALGQHDLHRAPMSVVNALTDPSKSVRTIAAWTLGQIEDTVAVRPLSRAFETETDTHVRTAELWALNSIGDVPTSVVEAAMKSSDPDLRRRGVSMLAGSGSWPWPWPWPWPRPNP